MTPQEGDGAGRSGGAMTAGMMQMVCEQRQGFVDELLPLFADHGSLVPRTQAVVLIAVTRALPLSSPADDDGLSEEDLRRAWTDRFRALQPGGRFVE